MEVKFFHSILIQIFVILIHAFFPVPEKLIMKKILLSKGIYTLVDDEDYPKLMLCKWWKVSSLRNPDRYYAYSQFRKNGKKITIRMHRKILGLKKGEVCDHIDGDGLNNQKSNLRKCTYSQNSMNQIVRSGRKFKGVSFHNEKNKYRAYITLSGRFKHLGYFDCEKKAALVYNKAAKRYFGVFANLNTI